MKRNALIRILLWGCLLAFLLYALFGMLYSMYWKRESVHIVEETMVPVTAPSGVRHAAATCEINVREKPNQNAEIVGMLHTGEAVEIVREDFVDGVRWSYLTSPIQGWVVTEYVSTTPESTVVTAPPEDYEDPSSLDPSQVREIEIDWAAGSIVLIPSESDRIVITEEGAAKHEDAFVWKLKDGKLSIDYCRDDDRIFSFGTSTPLSKDLTIQVPYDWVCASLEIDAASADVEISDLTIEEVEIDTASGTCHFNNCFIQKLDVETASGDVQFTGQLGSLECEAASANVRVVTDNVPSRLSLETMSGDLDITLPADAGFTLEMDTMREDFTSEFQDMTIRDGRYLRGDGSCRIQLSAMSGHVTIRKGTQ